MKTYLDFNDLNILPAPASVINSRSNCNIYDDNKMLPLFTAPMDTVVSNANADIFLANGIIPIIPRSKKKVDHTEGWVALSLDEFLKIYCGRPVHDGEYKVLIDIANGHMTTLTNAIKCAKTRYGDRLTIMAGNVAHPNAYQNLSDVGCDYVRVGIGNGAVCLTTQNTGIGYPMASLISDCYKMKGSIKSPAYIVADGGMQNYSDIIKALALGADYVMIGSIFNKAIESAGPTFREIVNRKGEFEVGEHVNQLDPGIIAAFKGGVRFYKHYRGMSTKEVQRALGRSFIRTSEGASRMRLVEYTLGGWVENFSHYLTTAMSYTNKKQLSDFIGKVKLIRISENSYNRYNK